MDTPDENCEFTYPGSLRDELKRAVGGLQIDIRHLGHMRTDAVRDSTLLALEDLEERRTRAALYLMEHHPTDVMMVVFNATDQAQHHFWHYLDPFHPQYDARGAKKYGDAILRIYKKVDQCIGQLLAKIGPETAVILVSDHGGGPAGPNYVYLNRYLQQLGLLATADHRASGFRPQRWFPKSLQIMDALFRARLTPQQKLKWSRRLPLLREKWESLLSFGAIDWGRTQAYAFENAAAAPNIWINLKGKKPNGIIEPGKEYEELVELLKGKLAELVDPLDGRPIIRKVYHKTEVYHGPYLDDAPDLILDWWNDDHFVVGRSFPCEEGDPVVVRRGKKLAGGVEWSGTHRMNGVSLFKGPGFRKGQQNGTGTIIDMAPTILFYLSILSIVSPH
jgi:predicted AlkP superfamily phosphohydrolase/phosphomutase